MRTIWTILTTVAVANMLAIGAFIGWLALDDRLDIVRLQRVREMLVERVSDEQVRVAEEQARAEAEANDPMRRVDGLLPVAAGEILLRRGAEQEMAVQHLLRREREVADLQATLAATLANLERRERDIAERERVFETNRARIIEREGSRQFRTAVASLEAQKPQAARDVLRSLLNTGGHDEVIAYLNAMDGRPRDRVIAEFIKEDPALAADLLESIRVYGLSDAQPVAAGGG